MGRWGAAPGGPPGCGGRLLAPAPSLLAGQWVRGQGAGVLSCRPKQSRDAPAWRPLAGAKLVHLRVHLRSCERALVGCGAAHRLSGRRGEPGGPEWVPGGGWVPTCPSPTRALRLWEHGPVESTWQGQPRVWGGSPACSAGSIRWVLQAQQVCVGPRPPPSPRGPLAAPGRGIGGGRRGSFLPSLDAYCFFFFLLIIKQAGGAAML